MSENASVVGEPRRWLGWRSAAECLMWGVLGVVTVSVIQRVITPVWGKSATFALIALLVLVSYAARSLWRRRHVS